MQWRIMIWKKLIIADIFKPTEQCVVVVQIPIGFGNPSGQCVAGHPILRGKGQHRGKPLAIGIMDAGCGAPLILIGVAGFRLLQLAMA